MKFGVAIYITDPPSELVTETKPCLYFVEATDSVDAYSQLISHYTKPIFEGYDWFKRLTPGVTSFVSGATYDLSIPEAREAWEKLEGWVESDE